ncbi:MAG TPA: aldose 1-epimerase family protein [Acidimicrobiales bacterium]|nr:aldose 1-epimerase family protein [Acidimicrobiales bacterium]
MAKLSGEQYRIQHGDQTAVITEVGATLRSYSVGGDEIVDGFAEDEICSGGRGQVLAPWPNRLDASTAEVNGVPIHLPVDEPGRNNAIHGLVRWLRWRVLEHHAAFIELYCTLAPQPAYPFDIGLIVSYSLDDAGLTVRARAGNKGTRPAPVGIGFHPYLRAAGESIDGATLTLPAERHLRLDDRGLPTKDDAGRIGTPVGGTDLDFNAGRRIGDSKLDDCFAGVWAAGAPRPEVRFSDPRRPCDVVLWMQGFDYVMVYTGDTLGDVDRRRKGIAIEPMSCAPNAFAAGGGDGLKVIVTGVVDLGSWGIRLEERPA